MPLNGGQYRTSIVGQILRINYLKLTVTDSEQTIYSLQYFIKRKKSEIFFVFFVILALFGENIPNHKIFCKAFLFC